MLIDSHNHLQNFEQPSAILKEADAAQVSRMVVNGTCERDWEAVSTLHKSHPQQVLPAFGLHPWELASRSENWLENLREVLEQSPCASIGECGLDRWKKPYDLEEQVACLRAQIHLARELTRPLTIHCLQAWGPLLTLLQKSKPLPPFLLHAYSGSSEMVPQFAKLGAYFSFSGYFLHERKKSNRETFRQIPRERLLIESDAPAMAPPPQFQLHPQKNEQNHPANLRLIHQALAKLLRLEPEELEWMVEENFKSFYRSRERHLCDLISS